MSLSRFPDHVPDLALMPVFHPWTPPNIAMLRTVSSIEVAIETSEHGFSVELHVYRDCLLSFVLTLTEFFIDAHL
jgi:hypothetical protein